VRTFPPLLLSLLGALAQFGGLADDSAQKADPGAGNAAPPRGAAIDFTTAPERPASGLAVCSLRHPLCVHAVRGTAASLALAALASADRAWDTLTEALAAPAPEGTLGETWHIYLVDGVDGGGRAALEGRDPRGAFDRASSFALVDRTTPPGCTLDLALARAVARGSLWRAAPATDEGSAIAEAEMLARLATPCAPADGPGEDDRSFASQPERTIVDPRSSASARGASLFFGWLDSTFGARAGALVTSLWALAPTQTPAAAPRWSGEPTGFDVLRVSLRNALWQGSTLEDVFVRFAVARALADPPPRPVWHVPWPARPRRLASPEPVAPTGATYVVVDRAGSSAQAKLRLEAEWEDYGRLRWVVVKLDAAGRALAEIPVGSLDRGTRASMTVGSLDGVDRLLVVAINVGSTDHGFDPNQGEWEPHGWLLTLEAQ
jgi:hypothetical protein